MKSTTELTFKSFLKNTDSYCSKLQPALKELKKNSKDEEVSLEEYKSKVISTVDTAKHTAKFESFIANVNKSTSKTAIFFYIKNSVKKAKRTFVPIKNNK